MCFLAHQDAGDAVGRLLLNMGHTVVTSSKQLLEQRLRTPCLFFQNIACYRFVRLVLKNDVTNLLPIKFFVGIEQTTHMLWP